MRFILLLLSLCTHMSQLQAQKLRLFVGTYTHNGSRGIYVYEFDGATGNLRPLANTDSAQNPSYLAISADGRFLYAANETGNGGGVSAYAVDPSNAALKLINQKGAGGDHPCYVAVSPDGGSLAVGNYSGGNFSIFNIDPQTGALGSSQSRKYAGAADYPGVKDRQGAPHVHATVFAPDGKSLFVTDLGLDRVFRYPLDGDHINLTKEEAVKTALGGGPRHLTFHPNGRRAYLMEELSGTVQVFSYRRGVLKPVQRISAQAAGYKGAIGSADIHVSPDGRHLYASNRGDAHNLAIFNVNRRSGKLTPAGHQSTLGQQPRNFTLDPTGTFLLAANQKTGNIVVFRRDPNTGALTDTGNGITLPSPVCLLFASSR